MESTAAPAGFVGMDTDQYVALAKAATQALADGVPSGSMRLNPTSVNMALALVGMQIATACPSHRHAGALFEILTPGGEHHPICRALQHGVARADRDGVIEAGVQRLREVLAAQWVVANMVGASPTR